MRPSRRPLLRPRRIAARMPSRWRRIVRASLTNGSSRDRDAHASQASRCSGASAGSRGGRGAELFARAGTRGTAACWPARPRRAGELGDGLLGGGLEQRPAGALDPLALAVWERSWAFYSSRRTWSTARWREAHDVERVKADLGVGDGCRGSRAGSRRTCRSRPPGSSACGRRARRRTPAGWRRCGPGAHHTIAPVRVVGDGGQVAVIGGGRRSRRRRSRPARPAGARRGDRRRPAATIFPTVSQPIRSRPVIGVLAICCASHATTSSKSRVCCAPGRGPRHRARAARRSRGSTAGAARTRSRSGWRRDPDAASA